MHLAVLLFTFLVQSPGTQADRARLAELNRQADTHLAAFQLEKAEPLIEEALSVAIRLGPNDELRARIRLAELYQDLEKRDGRDWRNLAIPQLRRAIELSKSAEMTNQLSVAHAIEILELPLTGGPLDLSSKFAQLLDTWIAQLEAKEGPLNRFTALPYDALTYSPTDSEAERRALHACDLLVELPPPDPSFSMLLVHCAMHELHALSEDAARRFTRFARLTAGKGDCSFLHH